MRLNHLELLGCSMDEARLKIQEQFKPEMNWDNHGEVWELDHVKPISLFDLQCEKQQRICFGISNLQPLFKTTDIAKSFGYDDEIGNRNKSDKVG